METLAIVATKGGVGKTTLAVHLAVAAQHAGKSVLLIDLDPQGSAAQWGKDRARLAAEQGAWFKSPLEVRRLFADDLADELDRAKRDGFDLVVIDTPPHADFPAARAVEVADAILIPTRPGYFDLHAAKATISLVRNLQARAFFVVNQVPHNNLRIADDAATYLESKGLRRAPGVITYLQPYVRALRNGLTAPELVPEGRHAAEIGALWDFLAVQCAEAALERSAREPHAPSVRATSVILEDPFADILKKLRGDTAQGDAA